MCNLIFSSLWDENGDAIGSLNTFFMGIEGSKVKWIRMGKDLIWAIEFNQWKKIGCNLSLTIVLEKDSYGSW